MQNYNRRSRGEFLRRRRRIRRAAIIIFIVLLAVMCVRFAFYGKTPPEPTTNGNQYISPVPTQENVRPTASPKQTENVPPTPEAKPDEQAPEETPMPPLPTTAADTDGLDAANPLWIKVSIADQKVFIYDANDELLKEFTCSTGLDGSETETPVGTYTIQERGESFFSQTYQQGAYYWTQFYGDYLFHSVPFDSERNIEAEEAAKLGTKASHGCVRLSLDDAKWIYDNIPRDTVVVIE